MGVILEEYGLLVIACVMGVLIMTLIHSFFFGEMSMVKLYTSDVPTMEVYYSDNANQDRAFSYSPHFVATSNASSYDMGDLNKFTKKDALNLVKIYTDDAETALYKGGNYDSYKGDVTIMVTRYDLVMTEWMKKNASGKWVASEALPSTAIQGMTTAQQEAQGWLHLSNPAPVYEEIDLVDKYGNRVWVTDASGKPITDASGNRVAKKQSVLKYYTNNTDPKYYWELGDSTNASDAQHAIMITQADMDANYQMPPRYKLVYRFEYGDKKSEYTTLIIKSGKFK